MLTPANQTHVHEMFLSNFTQPVFNQMLHSMSKAIEQMHHIPSAHQAYSEWTSKYILYILIAYISWGLANLANLYRLRKPVSIPKSKFQVL